MASLAAPLHYGQMQRSKGFVRVSTRKDPQGSTQLVDLMQSGCLRCFFPKDAGNVPDEKSLSACLVNSAGGIVAGDEMSVHLDLLPGSRLNYSSQSCEKIYRAVDQVPAAIKVNIQVAVGARLDYLPQETIFFSQSRLARSLTAEVAVDGHLLIAEGMIFGRQASGENLGLGYLQDEWRIRYDGQLVFAEKFRLEGEWDSLLNRPAVLNGQRAAATILMVSKEAVRLISALREVIENVSFAGEAGTSVLGPGLICRMIAANQQELRRIMVPVISFLRQGHPMPRTWLN